MTLGVTASFGQNIFSSSANRVVSGATNTVRNTVSNPVGTVKNVGGSAVSGLKGLASMPGKAFSLGDHSLPNLSAGTQTFGLSGNVQFSDDILYNLDLTYGYFFKDNWEVGFTAGVDGADSQLTLDIGLYTEYNFNLNSKWVPFVGASIALASLNTDGGLSGSSEIDDVTSVALGGEFGVKYFVRENIAITGSVEFQWSPDDVFGGLEDASTAAGNINVGTRFYF